NVSASRYSIGPRSETTSLRSAAKTDSSNLPRGYRGAEQQLGAKVGLNWAHEVPPQQVRPDVGRGQVQKGMHRLPVASLTDVPDVQPGCGVLASSRTSSTVTHRA